MDTKFKGRGGWRNGGRPKVEAKRVTKTIRVAPETIKRMQLLKDEGIKIGEEVDDLVLMLCVDLGLIEDPLEK